MRQQQGFTLIELIVVIVILGILAATALPKFADLSGDARRSALAAVEGSMRSAANMAHAASLASASSVVTIEGTAYNLTNTYPAAADINSLIHVSGGHYDTTTTPGTITDTSASTPANCKVAYQNAASSSVPPVITTTSGGC